MTLIITGMPPGPPKFVPVLSDQVKPFNHSMYIELPPIICVGTPTFCIVSYINTTLNNGAVLPLSFGVNSST